MHVTLDYRTVFYLTFGVTLHLSLAQSPQGQPQAQPQSQQSYDLHGSYFALRAGEPIVSERLDPIIQSGVSPSNHVHDIYGSSPFSATWTYANAQKSPCNNMGPIKDHSNYWFPALYHHSTDGTFTHIKPRFSAYYHFEITPENGPRVMFPPGLRIVAGNPRVRHNTSAEKAGRAIEWICYGQTQEQNVIGVGGFPGGIRACPGPNGLSGQIWLPFCWDGSTEFDPANPGAHVVYGDAEGPIGGKCSGPNGAHTRALPQLFLEFHHDITPFTNIPSHPSGAFVLSPGDPTGYGFHADFINGWEGGNRSLADAILPISTQKGETRTKCFVGLTGKEAAECFDMLEPAKVVGCRMEQSRKEDVEGPVKALPGCNAVQGESLQNAVMGKCDGGGGGGGGQQQMGSDQVQSQPQVQASPAASRQRQQRHKRRH